MSFLESKFGLKGKTVIVTGGGGVLCSKMGEGYACAGANVILWDIRQDALDEKVKQIADACGDPKRVTSVKVNLMDEADIQKGIQESVKKFGKVDVLVNGAGGNRGKGALVDVKAEDYDFVLKLNLMAGCVLPVKYMAQYWIENKIKGAVVNIASMAAYIPLSGVWAYSAAKAAVMNQTVGQARELAPYGIRVNAIAPGFIVADQNRRLLLNEDGSLTQRGKDVIAHTPMARFGEAEEMIGAAVFLACEGAGFVSGVVLPVDGAYLCSNI